MHHTERSRHLLKMARIPVIQTWDMPDDPVDHVVGFSNVHAAHVMVERMNRTIKEATVKRFHYESHDQLRQHLAHFVAAYNFGRRLKTLKGLTPYESICKAWASQPEYFRLNPLQQIPGLNI